MRRKDPDLIRETWTRGRRDHDLAVLGQKTLISDDGYGLLLLSQVCNSDVTDLF